MAPLGDDAGAFLVKGRFIHHKYTVIPSDQQELLSRPDAWNTKGIPNLPPKVLQDVKETYVRQLRSAAASDQATPERGDSSRANGSSRQRNGHSKHVAKEESVGSREHEPSDEEDEIPIPWTPSPSHHKQAPVRRDELPTPRRAKLRVPSSSPNGPGNMPPPPSSPPRPGSLPVPSSPPLPARQASPAMVSQMPVKKANRPTATRRAPVISPKASVVHGAPPSSLVSEPDLEYQPPRAITDVLSSADPVLSSTRPPPRAHRVLRSLQQPAPTPPSAQEPVTVPCTWKEPSSSGKRQHTAEEPEKKRRRLMKAPPFESSQAVDLNGAAPPSGSKQAPISLNDSQTSTSSSTLSMMATTPAKRYADPHLGRGPGPKMDREGNQFAVSPPLEPLTKVIQQSEKGYDSLQSLGPVDHSSFSSSGKPPPNGPASQAPYLAFIAAYPSYKGTLRDFVSAAISIIQLQESRSLAEFLYDDYIRVWAHHYRNYVANCIDADKEVLKAIKWYNEYVPRPVFTKRIFTKGNITDITGHHRKEAESCRRKIGSLHNDTSSSPIATSPATRVISQPGPKGLRPDISPPNHDVISLPAAISPPVATPGTPQPSGQAPPLEDPTPALPAQPVPTPSVNMHAVLRPDQIERIEPLRSVPGYVVTMSQSGSGARKRADDHPSPLTTNLPDIKEEKLEPIQAQVPPSSANTDLERELPATPSSTSDNRRPAPTFESLNPSTAITEHVATPSANAKIVLDSPDNMSAKKSGITSTAAAHRRRCLCQWNLTLREFEEFFSQHMSGETALQGLARLAKKLDWEQAKTLLLAAHAQRPHTIKKGLSRDPKVWGTFEVDIVLEQCGFKSYKKGPEPKRPGLSSPVMERATQKHNPSPLPAKSPSPSFGDGLLQAITAPAPVESSLHSGSKPAEAPAKEPPRPAPMSPIPSFGDVLTQPPVTAVSFISDFTKSIIPETAIKPKDMSRLQPPPAKTRISLSVDSENMLPASSAVPISSAARRKKLTKADRFRLFVEKRQAMSSAPKSTIEG